MTPGSANPGTEKQGLHKTEDFYGNSDNYASLDIF